MQNHISSIRVLHFVGRGKTDRAAVLNGPFPARADDAPVLIDLSDADSVDDVFLTFLGELQLSNPHMAVFVSDTAAGVRFLTTELFNSFRVYTNRDEALYRLRLGEA